jgi:hypothetical protein
MVSVSSRFGGDVDLPGLPAELGGVHSGLDLEFLNSFHRRQKDISVEVDVGVSDAIKSVIGPGGASSGQRHGKGGARPSEASARLLGGQEAESNVRGQGDQAEEIPTVQRQLVNALFLDDRADRGIFGAQHRSGSSHLDRLRRLSHREAEIDRAVCCTWSSILVFTIVAKSDAATLTWYMPGVRSGKL